MSFPEAVVFAVVLLITLRLVLAVGGKRRSVTETVTREDYVFDEDGQLISTTTTVNKGDLA